VNGEPILPSLRGLLPAVDASKIARDPSL